MKRKILIITSSIFLLGVLLYVAYYFFYLKKVAVYDLINIEFSGISLEENTAIKSYGVTPFDKKILLRKNEQNNIPGCYKYIEIVVPDTLVSKITVIHTILKSRIYTSEMSKIHSGISSGNALTVVLPSEVKSEGTFFDKLLSSLPFNIIKLSPYIAGMFFIIFCIASMWLITIFYISPKTYMQKLKILLLDKRILYNILFIAFIILLIWPLKGEITHILIILFFISFIVQLILLIRKSYIFYIIRVLLIIFLCFEVFFGILNSKKIVKDKGGAGSFTYQENYTVKDPILGYRFRSNCIKKRSTRIFQTDTVYNVYYSSDEFGRRISGGGTENDTVEENNLKTKHAIFLGCSFTFGDGLNYNSTFPFLFEYMHPDFKSYNYGFSGYGPHQSCLLFDEGVNTINNYTIPDDSGFCIYTYFDDHLNRVYGSSEYLASSVNATTPDVCADHNKLIHKKRSFLRICLAYFLSNSETMKYFNINFTCPQTTEFYGRFAGIINYTAMKYWEIKPHGEFYVGLYPGYYTHDTAWIRSLDRNIKVLNIPPPIDIETDPSYKIKYDGHPAKKLNFYYVEEISKLIFKN